MVTTRDFVGTWKLVSMIFQDKDGAISHPYGEHPLGYIFYTADGHVSVAFMCADRLPYQSQDLTGTAEEKIHAADTFFAYCGTYEVQKNEVVHHIEVCLVPNWNGKDQRRFYQFEGKQLTLSTTPQLIMGKEQSMVAVWERV